MGTLQVGGTTLATKNVSTGKVDLSANYRPPVGGVIRTLTFETSNGSSNDNDEFIPLDGSNTSIQIADYTKGNKLIIWTSMHYKIREGNSYSFELKSYYQTSSSSGAGTPSTSSPWILHNGYLAGFDTIIATSQNTEDSTTLLDVLTVSGSGTTHIDYAIYVDKTSESSNQVNDIQDQKRITIIQEIQG